MKVYLDMDGVIADFTAGWCSVFGIEFSNENYPFPIGLWDYVSHVEKVYGISWKKVAEVCSDPEFWVQLPLLPHAKFLYASLQADGHDILFLTTPTGDPGAVFDGKRVWLENYGFATPHDKQMFMLEHGETKEKYAAPDTILIDDKDSNVQEFIKGGGHAVLVPRPWNNRHNDFHSFRMANERMLKDVQSIVEDF